jgi:ribosomal protein S18 acetylase RimI-like enzyme
MTNPKLAPIPPGILFDASQFERIRDFSCARAGHAEERWEQDVSEWIKAPHGEHGALDAVRDKIADVWLYEDEEGNLIGFTSLGIGVVDTTTAATLPATVYTVPYFGIHTNFRGKPDGPREQRYAWRIFQGLIDEAERRGKYTTLTLYVDPANPAYQGFYPLFGFEEVDRVAIGEREWVRMARQLNPQSAESTSK